MKTQAIARVLRADSPPTRGRGSFGSGGESSSMLLVWRGMQYRRSQAFITELATSTRTQRKRMTNHNAPQLSGMDSANHCAAFPGLSALSTKTEQDTRI
jgi:hypothetical protein